MTVQNRLRMNLIEVSKNTQAADSLLNQMFPSRHVGKVLLVNPPDADSNLFRYDTAKRGRYSNYPPYGLAVLAKQLQTIGIEIRICNLNNEVLKGCQESKSQDDFNFRKCS